MAYSHGQRDFRITFVDRSWVRLCAESQRVCQDIVDYFTEGRLRISPVDLSKAQAEWFSDYLSSLPRQDQKVTYTRLSNGNIVLEVFAPPSSSTASYRMELTGGRA